MSNREQMKAQLIYGEHLLELQECSQLLFQKLHDYSRYEYGCDDTTKRSDISLDIKQDLPTFVYQHIGRVSKRFSKKRTMEILKFMWKNKTSFDKKHDFIDYAEKKFELSH